MELKVPGNDQRMAEIETKKVESATQAFNDAIAAAKFMDAVVLAKRLVELKVPGADQKMAEIETTKAMFGAARTAARARPTPRQRQTWNDDIVAHSKLAHSSVRAYDDAVAAVERVLR